MSQAAAITWGKDAAQGHFDYLLGCILAVGVNAEVGFHEKCKLYVISFQRQDRGETGLFGQVYFEKSKQFLVNKILNKLVVMGHNSSSVFSP